MSDGGSSTENVDQAFVMIATTLSNAFLFALVFGLSATVETDELWMQLRNKRAVGTGALMQFVVMPFLGYFAVRAFGDALSPGVGIILLVVTSSPGGSFSNLWCSMFNADLALSVAMTSISTLLSVVLLPCNLLLYTFLAYGKEAEESVLDHISWEALFVSLLVVIAAVATGLCASHKIKSKTFRIWANRGGTMSGVVLVVFSALASSFAEEEADAGSGGGGSGKIWERDWTFYVAVAFPCVAGLVIANIATCRGLKAPERVTLSVESCYQNCGIATSVAVALFSNEQERAEALGVPLFYGLVEAVLLSLYCVVAWKSGWTKAPVRERLCVVLTSTYEIKDKNYSEEKKGGFASSDEVQILRL